MSETILLTHTPDMRRNYYGDKDVLQEYVRLWKRDELLKALGEKGVAAEAVNQPGDGHGKIGRGDLDRHQRRVDAVLAEQRVEDAGRADLGDRIADDGVEPCGAVDLGHLAFPLPAGPIMAPVSANAAPSIRWR